MEEMKKAREKWLIKGRREIEEQEYHHKRKEAHKLNWFIVWYIFLVLLCF